MKYSKADQARARENFAKWLEPGDTVYAILESRSRSSMSRAIRLVVMKLDDSGKPYPLHPNWAAACLLGLPQTKRDGIKISGCGMDMGFEIVYRLGRALWPDGTPAPHGMRNGQPDSDGGYALKHQWL